MLNIDTAALWQPTLTGSRILLRPLAQTDFEVLYSAASEPLIWEQHPDRYRYKREGFQAYFQSGLESKGALVVIDLQSGEMIGSSRFRDHKVQESSIEIGYTFLTRQYWGKGYNEELKRLMLDHAFQFVDTVFFVVGLDNHRSRRALLKIGAVEREAIAISPVPVQTDVRCSVTYRMTKSAWE